VHPSQYRHSIYTKRRMTPPRLQIGHSDPISYVCTCSCSETSIPGSVLLFYRYFTNTPPLPSDYQSKADDPLCLAEWHRDLVAKYNLGGKIRIAKEGFNVTVGGTRKELDFYIAECRQHWSFAGLDLETQASRDKFFKPTPGCSCVFGTDAEKSSVRVTTEITPMGVTNYLPTSWDKVENLPPAEFHRRCFEEGTMLVDVRNHYESRIGYFTLPDGEPALRPAIRRFSQWPQYVRRRLDDKLGPEKQILSYCTGGIRCEKGVRYMRDIIGDDKRVATLEGGIAAYLAWMEEEIRAGRKSPKESLFRGKNYVFDGRGKMGLDGAVPVSNCHRCGTKSDNLSKCHSPGCHLILVACPGCDKDLTCCSSCVTMAKEGRRGMCACEEDRERELWGDNPQCTKKQGWKKARKGSHRYDISIKTQD
jgi:predicted sulfurtransferase